MPAVPKSPTPPISPTTIRRVRRFLEPLARYHRFTVEGLDNLPKTGPVLLAVHHSFATYDGFLIGGAIYEGTGRLPRGLGDDRIFQIPGLGTLARDMGLVPASPEAGEQLLREGHVLGVAPGGMWESLRPRDERRRSRWDGRKGFARLALRTGAPLVMAACPAADELYTVYRSRLTDRVYRRAHLPVPILRGIGPTVFPRPIKLTAYLSRPLFPPTYDPAHEDAQVDALHAEATAIMAELLART
ncbi:MAG: lysophospholipid acyltransferase family protein [Pseudomonadota bacterium]|nr:lysophospholipid acyltransferase family protein [Pseudomonadota bacterium]